MITMMPGNGHWASSRTTDGAKAVVSEHRMDRDRRQADRERERFFWRHLWTRVRGWFGKTGPKPKR